MMDLLSACGYSSIPKFVEKKELLKMIAKHEVLDKPRSALEQFKEGLSTLGVLDVMKQHPAEFETLFCYEGNTITANVVDNIFTPMFDPVGSNRRTRQELIVMYWRDYLQDTEGELKIKMLLHSTNNGKISEF